MKPEALRDLVLSILHDMKAVDIVTLDVQQLTTITDYMVICTGRSTRQNKAVAQEIATQAKHNHVKPVRVEGDQESDWVVVDLGDVVVHIMLATVRDFYSLEDLWEPIKELREQKQ